MESTRHVPGVATACVLACLASAVIGAEARGACEVRVDPRESLALADKVWRNESGRDVDKLLWWNPGEAFPSLGIGHFIWYPAGPGGPFRESFPELLVFLSDHGVALPAWLAGDPPPKSPWRSREEFMADRYGTRATELRRLLADTVGLQAAFMMARLELAFAAMLAAETADDAAIIEARFCALAARPSGRYALVDYVNFKGDGMNPEERYAGQGWGLRQVLEEMDGESPANEDFGAAAARVLERRVRNAPVGRDEHRWLDGWLRRVGTYARD